jgi:2TM domain
VDDEIIVPGMTEREIYIRRRVKRLAEFYRHLAMYMMITSIAWIATFVFMTRLPSSIWRWWVLWPTIGWGIGVLAHGLSVLPRCGFFSLDWEEKKVREIMRRDQTSDKS